MISNLYLYSGHHVCLAKLRKNDPMEWLTFCPCDIYCGQVANFWHSFVSCNVFHATPIGVGALEDTHWCWNHNLGGQAMRWDGLAIVVKIQLKRLSDSYLLFTHLFVVPCSVFLFSHKIKSLANCTTLEFNLLSYLCFKSMLIHEDWTTG